ncbi:MAG TPA: translation initiation factor [Flavobacteriales bacterium]|nr:translation initiation factor [Flavobacteriales bacterium]
MVMGKKKRNIVYSTDKEFEYDYNESVEDETLAPEKQLLKVWFERKHRAGKKVTLVSGFIGQKDDLRLLEKLLKARCGVGGSSKDGLLLIQGNFKEKVKEILKEEGYQVKG